MRVSASSAPNGSSSSSRSGSRTSARASAARWASPPDSVFGQSSLVTGEADLGERGARPRSAASRPSAGRGRRCRARWPRQQPRVLEHDRAASRARAIVARGAAVEAGERAQQGALARAAAAEQGHELAGAEVQVDAARARRAAPNDAGQAARDDRSVRPSGRSLGAAVAARHRPGCHRSSLRSSERTTPSVAGRARRRRPGRRRSRRSGRTSAPGSSGSRGRWWR